MAYKHKVSNYKLFVRIRSMGTESDMNSVINNNSDTTYMKPPGTLVLRRTLLGLHATLVSTRTCFFQTMLHVLVAFLLKNDFFQPSRHHILFNSYILTTCYPYCLFDMYIPLI